MYREGRSSCWRVAERKEGPRTERGLWEERRVWRRRGLHGGGAARPGGGGGAAASRGPCAGSGGHPDGQPESRARGARARSRGPGLRTRGASPRPDSPRLPAKPSILRGTRRARGSAGRELHSAHRPSGGRGARRAGLRRRAAQLLTPASAVRRSVRPLEGRSVNQVASRAARRLPGLSLSPKPQN